jgi:hypothetical protein
VLFELCLICARRCGFFSLKLHKDEGCVHEDVVFFSLKYQNIKIYQCYFTPSRLLYPPLKGFIISPQGVLSVKLHNIRADIVVLKGLFEQEIKIIHQNEDI